MHVFHDTSKAHDYAKEPLLKIIKAIKESLDQHFLKIHLKVQAIADTTNFVLRGLHLDPLALL